MQNIILNFKRVFWAGMKNYIRNGWLSVATTSIMTLTLYFIGLLIVMNVVINGFTRYLQDRLDMSVYFKPEVTEDVVFKVQEDLNNLPEVKEVVYVSKDRALENLYKSRSVDDRESIQSGIKEIGVNPLGHTLNIQTKLSTNAQYKKVEDYLAQEKYRKDVSRIGRKEDIINKVNHYSDIAKNTVLGLSFLLSCISALIIFISIKITIHNFRNEIEIMRLVGASHWYIRSPFMIEGILYGSVACVITTALIYFCVFYISDRVKNLVPTLDLSDYFRDNFILTFLFLMIVGIFIGTVSSGLAVRRYLREASSNASSKKSGGDVID